MNECQNRSCFRIAEENQYYCCDYCHIRELQAQLKESHKINKKRKREVYSLKKRLEKEKKK